MTNKEAIEQLTTLIGCNIGKSNFVVALKMAIEALEKQIPKKVDFEKHTCFGDECPACNLPIGKAMGKYCQHCGHALDWGEEQ